VIVGRHQCRSADPPSAQSGWGRFGCRWGTRLVPTDERRLLAGRATLSLLRSPQLRPLSTLWYVLLASLDSPLPAGRITRYSCPWVGSTRGLGYWVGSGWVEILQFSMGCVGSLSWWVGLGRVTENGPTDNSGYTRPSLTRPILFLNLGPPIIYGTDRQFQLGVCGSWHVLTNEG